MHIPVLLQESLDGLAIKEGGVYVDCTTNRGGHSIEIAKKIGEQGTLICIDLDQEALAEARTNMENIKHSPKIHFICSNYRYLTSILKDLKITHVDGILADLGLSSQELDESGRGFSFSKDEPLLMTFSAKPEEDVTTAYDIVNFWSESTIADVLYGFADERYSRRIARAIITSREEKPISTTFELVEIIRRAVPSLYQHRKTHYATKTFQALRMAVNDELGGISDLLEALPHVLASNGRACVITFHSTEDRVVKNGFKHHNDTLRIITKKPIIPQKEELDNNNRARSAQLRIVERI
ncbi:MAG: ribosomal small subunit methyltransferase [Candidatus Parcubacteria bacterium]|jgi:16S rRNA (cytosine1402-N4)-methyltransferase